MRKSSTIFVSAIAIGAAMFVPLKASAQGVSIYIGPGYPGYGAGYPGYGAGYPGYAYPAYPRYYGGYPAYGYAYPSTATATAVLITAVIGAKGDALPGELIGDGIAGTRRRGCRSHARLTAEDHRWKLI